MLNQVIPKAISVMPEIAPLFLSKDFNNETPLDLAVKSKNIRCIQLLI
jgi:hypothetical protein